MNSEMDSKSESSAEAVAKKKAEAKATFWVRVIFTGLVVALIAIMAAISIYGENRQGGTAAPADAADH